MASLTSSRSRRLPGGHEELRALEVEAFRSLSPHAKVLLPTKSGARKGFETSVVMNFRDRCWSPFDMAPDLRA